MDNLVGCQAAGKKTLMNAVEKFNTTVARLDELERLSKKLVDKFERTENMPKNDAPSEKMCTAAQPSDIIDLFMSIDARLDVLINKTGSNIEKIVNMID